MTKKQMAKKILFTAEKEHINLYHDISEQEVFSHVKSINWDELTDEQFDYEMLKLFSMFKEGHTSYFLHIEPLEKKLTYVQGKYFVLIDSGWKEISYFGKLKATDLYDRLKIIISYDTKEWLNHKIDMFIRNLYVFKLLNLVDNDTLVLTLTDGSQLKLKQKSEQQISKYIPIPPYSFKILAENILYFKYHSCVENKDYPFANFIEDITKEIEKQNTTKFILDLRDNTGGSDRVLIPFEQLVKKKKLNGVLLINNATHSSGTSAVIDFKKDFNSTLIGEPTGGANKHYGETKSFYVNGKGFSISTKLFDNSQIFGYVGAIQPDIFVERTTNDLLNGTDTILSTAIDYIQKHMESKKTTPIN